MWSSESLCWGVNTDMVVIVLNIIRLPNARKLKFHAAIRSRSDLYPCKRLWIEASVKRIHIMNNALNADVEFYKPGGEVSPR